MKNKKCNKRRFDKIKAMLVLSQALNSKWSHRRERRMYLCDQCKAWHLTSK